MPPKIRKVAKDKKTGIPKKYVPKGLSKEDREKQIKSIKEKKDRPKLESAKTKRSSHVVAFEKNINSKISSKYPSSSSSTNPPLKASCIPSETIAGKNVPNKNA